MANYLPKIFEYRVGVPWQPGPRDEHLDLEDWNEARVASLPEDPDWLTVDDPSKHAAELEDGDPVSPAQRIMRDRALRHDGGDGMALWRANSWCSDDTPA